MHWNVHWKGSTERNLESFRSRILPENLLVMDDRSHKLHNNESRQSLESDRKFRSVRLGCFLQLRFGKTCAQLSGVELLKFRPNFVPSVARVYLFKSTS